MTRPPVGHRSIDHTGDLAIEVWAPTEAALLARAAVALTELLTDGATVPATAQRTVKLECFDPEDRLVQWLSEVLYWATTEHFLLAHADVTLSPNTLAAALYGAPGDVACEIKAVTYHDLSLVVHADHVTARIVFDV
ncbi:MAG: archease [Myxococcota bacterium]